MFTGIIEEIGHIQAIEGRGSGARMRISAAKILEGTATGDSISTNGVCLTVASLGSDHFTADVMPETIARTSFANLHAGSPVNLERAAVLGGRIGGHIVSGHIDGVGSVASIAEDSDAVRVFVEADGAITAGIVEKGSVAIEGISLTVTMVTESGFEVSLIPHTFAHTNMHDKRRGSLVNVECDVIGKYVFRALEMSASGNAPEPASSITLQMLRENGF